MSTSALILAGIGVAVLAVSLGVGLILGRGIALGDQTPVRATAGREPLDMPQLRADDALVEAVAIGRAQAQLADDPHLTRLLVAWRAEIDDDTQWPIATWDAAEVLDVRDEGPDT